jgi:sec-independent protein translocase protein TatB
MFDLSLAEVLLVVAVTVVFIGPKELPVVLRAISKFMRYLRSLAGDIRKIFDDLAKESGAKEFEDDIKMIRGDDGKLYESYDMTYIHSSPSQGEDKGGG